MNYHQVQFAISGLGTVSEYHAGFAGNPVIAPNPTNQGWTLFTNSAPSTTLTNFPVSPDTLNAPGVDAYRLAVLSEPGLVGYYPVDGDTAPTLTDRRLPAQNGALTNNALIVTGAGTVGTHAMQGGMARLGAVPEYQFSNGVGTVEAWLYQTNTSAYNPCFFSVRSATQTRYSLHADSTGTNRLWFWNGTDVAIFPTPTSMLNQRVHVAFVFTNNTVTAYFNGCSLGTQNLGLGAAGQPCQIGASNPTNAEPWLGRIDELAVYTNAQSAAAIASRALWLDLNVSYNTGAEVPLEINGFTATGRSVNFTLNYPPATGTELMVVKNTGLGFIQGTFDNLTNNQPVTLSFGGINYNFVAYYYGGSGNDLVLVWAGLRAFAWGRNDYGQLGNGSSVARTNVPVAVSTNTGALSNKTVVAIAGGRDHSLALCSDGTVAAWGNNGLGQLGNGSTMTTSLPVAVSMNTGALSNQTVVAIAAGYAHSLALCSDGTVAAWGRNFDGQLGNGSTISTTLPVAVSTNTGALSNQTVVAIAGGWGYSLALAAAPPATAPTIACPGDLTTNVANGASTVAVSWTAPTATGNPAPMVTCAPPFGFEFPVGSTLVTCTASNVAGVVTCPFTVTVCATNIVVANASDSGPGSLRAAIANACPGGTITFDPLLNRRTIVLTNGELVIGKNLTILGPGATNLAISGNTNSRVFSINTGVTCTLAGLTITNGNGQAGDGGGILNRGTLTVSNCTLSGNSAGRAGGGIYNSSDTLTVQNSTLSDNSATEAGGITYNFSGTLTVQNCTLSGNSAEDHGGGIYNVAGTLTVQNSTLSGNSGNGGGISASGTERLTNCIVAGNFRGSGTTTPNDIVGTVESAAYNLIGSTGLGATNGNIVLNNTLPITSILDTNLVFNGGPTRTHALVPGSLALNAGTNVVGLPTFDQRGPGFSRLVDGRVDIGAYELDCGNQGGPPYFGDVNADGLTFLDDFATLRANLGSDDVGRAEGDLSGNGTVELADYNALRNRFGHAAAQCFSSFTPPAGIPHAGYSGLSLRLLFDGTVEIVNRGAVPVAISGYSLSAINEALNSNAWRSLNALATTNRTYLTNTLGAGAAFFATANPTSRLLSELNLNGVARFQPGFALSLGQPYVGSLDMTNDVRFFYVQDGVVREGAVNRAPVAIPGDIPSLRAGDSCVADVNPAELNFQSSDYDGDPLTFGVTPPGPSPIGGTPAFFWAIDNKGASNGTSILISVVDTAPPRFTNCPGPEIVMATPPGSNTVQVFFEAGATDSCSSDVTVSCSPPSESYFPIGETVVVCTAFAPGGSDECRFVVIVAEPEFSVASLGLPPVSFGAAAWGDYDNDGWLDLVLTGGSTNGLISQIWRNQGDNTFSNINAGLPGLDVSAAAWGDLDNDGRLDLAIAGSLVSGQKVTQLWRNTGNGFVNLNAGITGVDDGALAWGDYDNDGRLDLLLTGVSAGPRVTQVWRNQGNNTFSNINANLPGTSTGGAAWGDYDNDGRLDVLLTGFDSGGGQQSTLWRNVGGGAFERAAVDLPGLTASAVAWADYDGDGWLDLAIAGSTGPRPVAQVWRNTGGSFSNINAALPGVAECSVAWGDYDNDGKPDLLLTGKQRSGGPLTQIWRNNGSNFVNTPSGLAGVYIGKGAWGDYNNDGRLDAVLVGSNADRVKVAQVWRNNVQGPDNTVPAAPGSLAATATATGVALRWHAAMDAQTPSPGLSYNVAIGTSAGGIGVLGPQANLADGWRRLPALGNAQPGTNAVLDLPPGTYFWAVQAVDSAWAGGRFADGGSFVVGNAVEVRIIAYEQRSATEFWLRFTGVAGTAYRVEWSENLTTWNDLGAPSVTTPGVFEYLDATATPGKRFYRVIVP